MMFVVAGGLAFRPSGMTKNGAQATTTSFADITGWTADTGTYPGSSVNSNTSLVAQAAKTGATLTANIPFSGGTYTFGTGTQVRILVNGTVVGTGTAVQASSGTATCTVTGQTIASGDLVKVQILASGYSGQPSVTTGAGTYVRIT
ncbi:hypothetical protein ACIBG0_40210 [Nocardia sp. NPDC050630]|uniref:hypothetical protein n=1 Tax=Nocardia sp. NPDC050630 TaxID=3364321 RepID=UPI0037AC6FA6